MAENTTKEVIIFELDVDDYQSKLVGLTQNIENLKKQQEQLREVTEKGGKGYLAAAKELEQVNANLKINQDQYRNTQRALVGFTAATKQQADLTNFSNNSIKTNRELLKQLTAQYVDVKKPTEAMTKQIKSLSDELKNQESAIGNNVRNVGNYKEGFKEALGSITNVIPGLKGFQTAQLGVNTAMNANPIGAVVLLLTSLKEIFGSNAIVADKLSFAMSAINKAIGSVIDTVVETVTNFDKFTEALKNPIQFLFNLGKGAASAAKEGYAAAEAIDALKVTTAQYGKEIAKNNIQIEEQTTLFRNTQLDGKKRTAAAKEVIRLENDNAKKRLALVDIELQALRTLQKGRTLSAEEQAKLIDLEAKRDDVQAQGIREVRRATLEIEKLFAEERKNNAEKASTDRRKLETQELKSLDDFFKKEADIKAKAEADAQAKDDEAFIKRQENVAKRFGDTDLLISLERQRTATILENTELTENERLLIIEESEQRIRDIKQKANDKVTADTQKAADDQVKIEQAKFNAASAIVGAFSQLLNAFGDQSAAAVAFQKVLAGVQIAIDTARAISNVIVAATAAGAFAGPLAIVTTIANIATGIGAVFANIASARKLLDSAATPPAPKFAEGGEVFDVGGRPHSQGGTKYVGDDGNVFEAERDEKIFVMKKTAAQQIHRLSQWNEKFGGRSWVGTNPISYAANGGVISDGGFSTSDSTSSVKQMLQMERAIKKGFAEAPQPVVSVREIAKVSKAVNRSVGVSELG